MFVFEQLFVVIVVFYYIFYGYYDKYVNVYVYARFAERGTALTWFDIYLQDRVQHIIFW